MAKRRQMVNNKPSITAKNFEELELLDPNDQPELDFDHLPIESPRKQTPLEVLKEGIAADNKHKLPVSLYLMQPPRN